MWVLLYTIIRGREQSDQESVSHGKIALVHEHNWAPTTTTSSCGVARTSARRLDHPAWAGFFLDFFSPPPTPPPGGRFYLASSPTKNPEEEDTPRIMCTRCLESGPRHPGSWLGNLPNRKPTSEGKFPVINSKVSLQHSLPLKNRPLGG